MQFVANLRPQTIHAFANKDVSPGAYLLSTHRVTRTTLRYAHALREKGTPLFSDNGTKQLIDRVIETYTEAARPIATDVRRIQDKIGRIPRGKSVPKNLRQKASDLAHMIVDNCTECSSQIDWNALLEQQLAMRPTHLIAQEDFAVACLIALDLERETTGWDVEYFDQRNQRSLRLFERVAGDRRCQNVKVYAVLSAMDYNTARSAGNLAARIGAAHVALGTAGIMRDPSAVDFFVIGQGSYKLDQLAHRRYVRTAQIVRGITDGFRDLGVKLKAFHALGLGAATMFPIVAAAVDSATILTVDATSPIHDAARDHVLYDPNRNGDRLSRLDIAKQIVHGRDWVFSCPFCQEFRDKHGHSDYAAKEWWEQVGRPELRSNHLSSDEPLAQFIPLFARLKGAAASEATRTHIAHNHWVLERLSEDIPDGPLRQQWAMDKIEEMIGYESAVTSEGLRAAKEVLQKT